ncbi:transposase [Kitasatospora sp. NPDC056138]|uniref:transposase n=1 Tax=Kitasatospora sp. NPDC056138 TaxID=3345724 RepID=UPI0035DAA22C
MIRCCISPYTDQQALIGHIGGVPALAYGALHRHREWSTPGPAGHRRPLLLVTLVETGTRAVLAATFGPEADGKLTYAKQLLSHLDARMLVLADAGFDAVAFLRDIHATGAQFLVRSSTRRPIIWRRLPDGSYLTRFVAGPLPVDVQGDQDVLRRGAALAQAHRLCSTPRAGSRTKNSMACSSQPSSCQVAASADACSP